jgi:hypothetical protein
MSAAVLFVKKRGFLMIEIALSVVFLLLIIRPFMSMTRHIAQQSHSAKIKISSVHEEPKKPKLPIQLICLSTKNLSQKALEGVVVHV